MFVKLAGCGELPASVVATGRFGTPLTVDLGAPALPVLRFLERVRVHYPSIELVAEAELSRGSDPYLDDHLVNGVAVMPVVVSLEAMASAATALAGARASVAFADVACTRPVTVPSDGGRVVRVAAIMHADRTVEVAIRSDETGFQADHVRATLRVCDDEPTATTVAEPRGPAVDLDPATDLYGGVLFQGPPFQRVDRYRELRARSCVAEVRADARARWYGAFLPQALVLADPAARDAVIHAIQCCIPHERVVPVGASRIWIAPARGASSPSTRTSARPARDASSTTSPSSTATGAHASAGRASHCSASSRRRRRDAGPRRCSRHISSAGWVSSSGARRSRWRSRRAAATAPGTASSGRSPPLGAPAEILRRPDGCPFSVGGEAVSAAYLDGYTLAVAGDPPIACDVEVAANRSAELWTALLGGERRALAGLLADESGEEVDIAATRVWAAFECLKKAAIPIREPLKLASNSADGWTLLRGGSATVATLVTRVRTLDAPVAIAILAGTPRAGAAS